MEVDGGQREVICAGCPYGHMTSRPGNEKSLGEMGLSFKMQGNDTLLTLVGEDRTETWLKRNQYHEGQTVKGGESLAGLDRVKREAGL